MSPEKPSRATILCPTCGTRLSQDTPRCLVCGTDLTINEKGRAATKAIQGSRMPAITLGLPAVIGLLTLFLAIGAGLVYFAIGQTAQPVAEPTLTPTITFTPTLTPSPTPETPTPTFTPLPTPTPLTYIVQENDLCGGIAFQFNVSIQSIVLLNNLPADCGVLYVGQKLLIPQPTPTATPLPTSTLSPAEATEAACEKIQITVQEQDTLSSISFNYQVPIEAIREYNGLVSDIVRFGQPLIIPLCRRSGTPGPTPTPTQPPPYPAPNLLLPADGATFVNPADVITLQWATVGTLRQNEAYAVTVEDVTGGEGRKLVEYVTDTKLIVPASFRPTQNLPYAMRWWVIPVRQIGTNNEGDPIWEPAGAASPPRVFVWQGGPASAPVETPQP